MVAFNPQTQVQQAPDYTGASRGTGGNRAFGDLFEGLGQLVTGAAGIADASIQEDIKQEVQGTYDTVNQIYGVDDATNLFTPPGERNGSDLPKDINDSKEFLAKAAKARAQGKLSESQYYARLEADVRRLRSKYPGYRDKIDEIVSSVTGVTPANALRRSLMAEWDAEAGESQNEKNRVQDLIFWAMKDGSLPANYEELMAADPTGRLVTNAIGENKRSEYERAQRVSRINEAKLAGEDVKERASGELKIQVGELLDRTFNEAAGLKIQEQIKAAGADGNVSDEEMLQITEGFKLFEAETLAAVNKVISRPLGDDGSTFASVLSKDKIDEAMALAGTRLSIMRDQITNQQYGLLSMNQRVIQNKNDRTMMKVMDSYPTLNIMKTIKDLGGEAAVNMALMNGENGLLNSLNSAVQGLLTSAVAAGQIKSMDEAFKQALQMPDRDPAIFRKLVTDALQFIQPMMTDGSGNTVPVPLPLRQNAARVLFSPENKNFLDNIAPEARMQTWLTLSSPATTKAMKELGGSEWKNYVSWTASNFMGLFKQTADTVQSGAKNKFLDWNYDPESNQFVYQWKGGAATSLPGTFTDNWALSQAQNTVNAIGELNKALMTMKPILSEDGRDINRELGKLVEAMGIDPEEEDQPSFMEKLGQQILKNLSGDGSKPLWEMDSEGGQGGKPTNPFDKQSSIFDIPTNGRPYRGTTLVALRSDGATEPPLRPELPLNLMAFEVGTLDGLPEGATSLHNVIGGVEAPLGYNQIYGRGKTAPLDSMTIDEVLSFQRERVRKGSPSSAVGRYQFIRKTLRSLKDELGLKGDEKFTPELQDKLATALMKRRGLDKFQAGEMTAEEFADNLSMEWASLPYSNGRSYYSGDGLNESLMKREEILNVLNALGSNG